MCIAHTYEAGDFVDNDAATVGAQYVCMCGLGVCRGNGPGRTNSSFVALQGHIGVSSDVSTGIILCVQCISFVIFADGIAAVYAHLYSCITGLDSLRIARYTLATALLTSS